MKGAILTVEIAAWGLGIVLLAAYGATRHRQALGLEAGVAAFELARHEHPATTRMPSLDQPVDTSTWSPKRVDAYRNSSSADATPEAVLRIPRLELVVPVFVGTSDHNLDRGAGFIEGTRRAGGAGNIGIAAHRDGFFRALKDVRIGDTLFLQEPAYTYIYEVVATSIVPPTEVRVLEQTSVPTITLVTCYPFYFVGSAPKRFIVHARLRD